MFIKFAHSYNIKLTEVFLVIPKKSSPISHFQLGCGSQMLKTVNALEKITLIKREITFVFQNIVTFHYVHWESTIVIWISSCSVTVMQLLCLCLLIYVVYSILLLFVLFKKIFF